MDIFNSLSVSLLGTLPLVPASIGFYIALRALRFPDLTVEGSLILGAAITAYGIEVGYNPIIMIIISIIFGIFAGLLTALWNIWLKVPEFTSGIITTFALTSLSFWILKGLSENGSQINEYLIKNRGIFEWLKNIDDAGKFCCGEERFAVLLGLAIIVVITIAITAYFLQTKVGLLMRAYGSERKASQIYNKKNYLAIYGGLALANGLVAFSGSLVVQVNSFVDLEKGATLLVPLIASVVFGEFLVVSVWKKIRGKNSLKPLLSRPNAIALAPALGFMMYNTIVLFVGAVLIPSSVFFDNYHKYVVVSIAMLFVLAFKTKDRTDKDIGEII